MARICAPSEMRVKRISFKRRALCALKHCKCIYDVDLHACNARAVACDMGKRQSSPIIYFSRSDTKSPGAPSRCVMY